MLYWVFFVWKSMTGKVITREHILHTFLDKSICQKCSDIKYVMEMIIWIKVVKVAIFGTLIWMHCYLFFLCCCFSLQLNPKPHHVFKTTGGGFRWNMEQAPYDNQSRCHARLRGEGDVEWPLLVSSRSHRDASVLLKTISKKWIQIHIILV